MGCRVLSADTASWLLPSMEAAWGSSSRLRRPCSSPSSTCKTSQEGYIIPASLAD